MKKLLITLFFLLTGAQLFAQSALRVEQDTIRVRNAELIISNQSRGTRGVLINKGDGRTEFSFLQLRNLGDTAIALIGQDTLNYSGGATGKSVQFKVGVSSGFPVAGDSTYTNASLANRNMKIWRNGLFQYRDPADGVLIDSTTGKITFRPALIQGERVYIEAMTNISLTFQQPPPPSFFTNLTALYAGAFDNGNNTFVLRWTTNQQTLTTSPRILGLGSSTLAGSVLSSPNRLGDKIQAWLNTNTTSPVWINLAVGGYDSRNLLPTASGGTVGHNIDSALLANPDFIFVSLPSNDIANGLTVNQVLTNFRLLDTMAQHKGITVFFETMQPRTLNATQQTQLKVLSDSIRTIWPTRFVEGFTNTVDASAATDAIVRSEYAFGDGIHLNEAGTQVIANSLFARWQAYFQPIQGVSGYEIESSTDGSSWSSFDVVTDPAITKKTYNKPSGGVQYFRVKAHYTNSTYSAYSNTATYFPVTSTQPPGGEEGDPSRILVDLGGDGVNTNSAGGLGVPTTSPDANGRYWNNWHGYGGASGFINMSAINNLKGTDNSNSNISLLLIGSPYGTYVNTGGVTEGLNNSGPTSAVQDYPASAVQDNMFLHSSINPNGVVLRIKGLNPAKQYSFKLWGGRVDAGSSTPRILATRLSSETWDSAKTINCRYDGVETPSFSRAIVYSGITGKDSVDIVMRPGSGSTFAHLNLIDIGISDPVAGGTPVISVRDSVITLPVTSLQLPGIVNANGNTITAYQWTQLTGPNTATLTNANTATCSIGNLTNGTFSFRFTVTFNGSQTYNSTAIVTVLPDNEGKKTMRVNFSGTAAPAIPGWFNVYGIAVGVHVVMTDPVTNWTVDNVAGNSTYWATFGGGNSSDTAGMVTGNNSGVVPDLALKSYWFNYDVNYNGSNDNVLIKNLDPSKTYTLKLVGSRSSNTTPPRYAAWRINGGTVITQNAYMNTSLQHVANNVAPDSNGVIRIAVFRNAPSATYGDFSYLNALIVQEE